MPRPRPTPRALVPVLLAGLVALLLSSCGGEEQAAVKVALDWVPNPDHVGLYYAEAKGYFEEAGLELDLEVPSDPTAPLKLVGVNQVDLAISYEPELFFAAEKQLPVVAVASVIPVPLNSLVTTAEAGISSVADLAGRSIGVPGIPTTDAFLATMLDDAGVDQDALERVNVGYNLLPSLLSGKVDAVLGAYRNVEAIEVRQQGREPVVIPVDQAGVPTYDELVLVANSERLRSDSEYADMVERFVAALVRGSAEARGDRAESVAIMRRVTEYEPEFLEASVPATLDLLAPPGGRPIGCMDPAAWQSFGGWMHEEGLLPERIDAAAVLTNAYLPVSC